MNRRDYHDSHSKSVYMAECLSPTAVPAEWFFAIYAPSDLVGGQVKEIAGRANVRMVLDVNQDMFL
jgi:hypothetical protein